MTSLDKLTPNDPRAQRKFTTVNEHRWSYLDCQPPSPKPTGTIILIHGFPDLSLAWRYQIPLFLSLNFRCIALDCMGYGETGNSEELKLFSFRSHADAIAAICKVEKVEGKVVLGGHDWGGITVYRVAQWYPELVSHIFSVCTAYVPPSSKYVSAHQLATTILPQFGYQLQLGSSDNKIEKAVNSSEKTRKFLNGMYGGRPSSGRKFLDPKTGIDLHILSEDSISPTPLLSEDEFDFYVKEFVRNGVRGPCNWYRTREINFEDELNLPDEKKKIIPQPTLYILATKDDILTREMSASMERHVPNLTRGEVNAGHWALWQAPEEVNALLEGWLKGVVLGEKSKL